MCSRCSSKQRECEEALAAQAEFRLKQLTMKEEPLRQATDTLERRKQSARLGNRILVEETSFGQLSVDTSTNKEVDSLEDTSRGLEEGVAGRRKTVRRRKEFRPFRHGRREPEVEQRLGKCQQM